MEEWSDQPIDEFRIKIFVDTNILAYLVDKTFSGLNITFDFLKENTFCDLISSQYVIYEFIGIRKREHYFRELLKNKIKEGGDIEGVNISSLLRYKEAFSYKDLKYDDVKEAVKSKIKKELEIIAEEFEINCKSNETHKGLWEPAQDICLSSKVSKEDSIVLISALLPNEHVPEEFVYILSNDQDFVQYFNEADLNLEFVNHSLKSPYIEYIKGILYDGDKKINLTLTQDDNKIAEFLPKKLLELIAMKNKGFFLGKTIRCQSSLNDLICFELNDNISLFNNLFLTIIGKNLDFIYTTRSEINDFWNHGSIKKYPHTPAISKEKEISFKIMDIDDEGNPKKLPNKIVNKLREVGNYVFVHPDSNLA